MVRPAFAFDEVDGSTGMRGLQQLLQGGLVIAKGRAGGEFAGQVGGGAEDVALGKTADGGEIMAGVEVDGGNDGFHGIGQECSLAAAAGALFTAAEAQMLAKSNLLSNLCHVTAADELGTHASQLTLLPAGVPFEEGFCHDQTKNGVSQELQAFVVGAFAFFGFAGG